MPRYLDVVCELCKIEVNDLFVMKVPDRIIHLECGRVMNSVYRARQSHVSQLSEKDAIVVFKKPDGSISYPGRNDSPTPAGCERIELRTRRAVDQFCKRNNVRHEATDFDKGTGRGHDDTYRGERY
jgi:hypothetical protein